MRLLRRTSRRPSRLVGVALVLTLLGSVTASSQAAVLPPGPTTTVPAPNPVDPYTPHVLWATYGV